MKMKSTVVFHPQKVVVKRCDVQPHDLELVGKKELRCGEAYAGGAAGYDCQAGVPQGIDVVRGGVVEGVWGGGVEHFVWVLYRRLVE